MALLHIKAPIDAETAQRLIDDDKRDHGPVFITISPTHKVEPDGKGGWVLLAPVL